jgi:hypothetical protein
MGMTGRTGLCVVPAVCILSPIGRVLKTAEVISVKVLDVGPRLDDAIRDTVELESFTALLE